LTVAVAAIVSMDDDGGVVDSRPFGGSPEWLLLVPGLRETLGVKLLAAVACCCCWARLLLSADAPEKATPAAAAAAAAAATADDALLLLSPMPLASASFCC